MCHFNLFISAFSYVRLMLGLGLGRDCEAEALDGAGEQRDEAPAA
jgi:hypothetical protein